MIYFIITACILDNNPYWREHYFLAINQLKKIIKEKEIKNYKIIIVENNGKRETYLDSLCNDEFQIEMFYTNHNFIKTKNKGVKELIDVQTCIQEYKIKDDDFIIKLTGRYYLNNNSNFMEELSKYDPEKTDCIIRYGPYMDPNGRPKEKDCVTGCIGMKCKYVKQIELPDKNECVEHKWAEITYNIEDEKIRILNKIGMIMFLRWDNYKIEDTLIYEV